MNELTYLSESEAISLYDEMLDDVYDNFMDKYKSIAYRCGKNDYFDSLARDGYVIEGYNEDDYYQCDKCGKWYEYKDEMVKCCNDQKEEDKNYE